MNLSYDRPKDPALVGRAVVKALGTPMTASVFFSFYTSSWDALYRVIELLLDHRRFMATTRRLCLDRSCRRSVHHTLGDQPLLHHGGRDCAVGPQQA